MFLGRFLWLITMRQLVLLGVMVLVVQLYAAEQHQNDQCHYSVRQQCSSLPRNFKIIIYQYIIC